MREVGEISVVGGGLAGVEVAWQLAEGGSIVRLVEMKPLERSPAHKSDLLAELVCSNSLRSNNPNNAVGLLKREMARLGSIVIRCAEQTQVPAGDALAVNRADFSAAVTRAISEHPRIRRQTRCIVDLPACEPHVVATGPLTAAALARDIAEKTGSDRMFFYDAIAPIVSGDSIDRDIVFAASRYGKGDGDDYLNCPLGKDEYESFIDSLLAAECMPLHDFEEPKYFAGCMPVEVVAADGRESLRFGTMKPVGLTDPRTGRRPYAVVQLRQEDKAGQSFNLVGFQTKLKHPDQRHVFRMIPGLHNAEFLRLGGVHRNTFIDAPALLDERMRLRGHEHVRLAGQLTGVEGYVESAAHGLLVGYLYARELAGKEVVPPPPETALGALYEHVRGNLRLPNRPYEPQNINWGMFPPPPPEVRKREVKQARADRAIKVFAAWAAEQGLDSST
ncbi:MAG: methylenetetrahydrofolate--tRNA-(uracil(54)-C(5))-methyltransferase (FADH(2)-oxidizing) TrmFO [Deltaproteobacteria bacterium RIFOXYA12_FULL_58_15]|nr:MAG: methylenetetrahydrofolate--tRNA-(uracil(54)-C(5))-methyltransferase (FADH(2)-oxidizing) TrmFO [Deltaproteobacteria bacterium RIFOXYA12_FULL_58_15]OGR13091.1 MAG: methylenetetrahydrofolate--tRNA-(uracil(54)-C(5))-methyltransferase (FADH(2)-oxidizing) TrmFO [Deltaproteobacteria bacterium RIFOXYB12_FULL_58_9]